MNSNADVYDILEKGIIALDGETCPHAVGKDELKHEDTNNGSFNASLKEFPKKVYENVSTTSDHLVHEIKETLDQVETLHTAHTFAKQPLRDQLLALSEDTDKLKQRIHCFLIVWQTTDGMRSIRQMSNHITSAFHEIDIAATHESRNDLIRYVEAVMEGIYEIKDNVIITSKTSVSNMKFSVREDIVMALQRAVFCVQSYTETMVPVLTNMKEQKQESNRGIGGSIPKSGNITPFAYTLDDDDDEEKRSLNSAVKFYRI